MSHFTKDTYLNPSKTKNPQNFPLISKPKIVGYFSVDKDRRYISDASNCKYIRKTNDGDRINYDLNEGFERVVHKPDSAKDEKLVHLLSFISRNLKQFRSLKEEETEKCLNVDVVCFRGLLRLLMCTPYEGRDPWTILATKYKGTIYLCALETEERKMERLRENEMTERIFSYGFKFEQYMMTGL